MRQLNRGLDPGGTSIGNLREFFFVNLHSEFPLYYFFLFCNVREGTGIM